MSVSEMSTAAGALLNGYCINMPNVITLSGSKGTVQIDPATRTLVRSYGSSKKAQMDHYNLRDIVRVDIAFDDSRFSAVGDIARVVASLIPGGLVVAIVNYQQIDPNGTPLLPDITSEMKGLMTACGSIATLLFLVYSHRNIFRMLNRLLRIFFFCCIRNGTVSFGLRGGPYDDTTLSLGFFTCGDDTGLSSAVADVVFDEARRPRDVTPLYPQQHQGLPQLGDSNILEQWSGHNSCAILLHEKSVSIVPEHSCISINESVVRHELADIGLIRTGVHTGGDNTMVTAFLAVGCFAGGVLGVIMYNDVHTLALVGFAICALCMVGICCLCCRGFNLELSIYSASNSLLPPCTFVGLAGEEVNHIVSAIRAQQQRLRCGPEQPSPPSGHFTVTPGQQGGVARGYPQQLPVQQQYVQQQQQYVQQQQQYPPQYPLQQEVGARSQYPPAGAGAAYYPPENTAYLPRPQ